MWNLYTVTAVQRVGMVHRMGPHRSQEKDLEIFVEEDLKDELHSGQTDGVQEVEGLGTIFPQGEQAPKARLVSSYLVEKLSELGPRSAHNVVEKGLFQAGTGSRGV